MNKDLDEAGAGSGDGGGDSGGGDDGSGGGDNGGGGGGGDDYVAHGAIQGGTVVDLEKYT